MPSWKPKYPAEARLRCACGRQGSVLQIAGHRSGSRLPICKQEPNVLSGNGAGDGVPLAPEVLQEQRPVGGERADSAPAPAPPAQARPARPPGQRKPSAVARGEGRLEVKEPPPRQTIAAGTVPDPPMVSSGILLPVKYWAMYDACRADPELAFSGSMSEFVSQCLDAFFDAIGYEGVRLVRRGRAYALNGEAA